MQFRVHIAERMRTHARVEKRGVGNIGQHSLIGRKVLRHAGVYFYPNDIARFRRLGVENIFRADRTHFKRAAAQPTIAKLCGNFFGILHAHFVIAFQRFRVRRIGHLHLVLAAFLRALKAGRHVENLFAVLHRNDPPRGKACAVARPINFIDNRRVGVAGAQEIAVKTMAEHIFHRVARGHQRLAENLPAKHALALFVRALAAKQINFQLLKLQQPQNRL